MEKKRIRPTVGQVRELERKVSELEKYIRENTDVELKRKLDEQIDGTSMLIKECDGWRDTYREKCAELDKANGLLKDLCADYDKLKKSVDDGIFDQSKEIKKLKSKLEEERLLRKKATEDYQKVRNEVIRLKGRNLWQRILNR